MFFITLITFFLLQFTAAMPLTPTTPPPDLFALSTGNWSDDFGPLTRNEFSLYFYSKAGLLNSGVNAPGQYCNNVLVNTHGLDGSDGTTTKEIDSGCMFDEGVNMELSQDQTGLPEPLEVFTGGLCSGVGSPWGDYSGIVVKYAGATVKAVDKTHCEVASGPGGMEVSIDSDIPGIWMMRCKVFLAPEWSE